MLREMIAMTMIEYAMTFLGTPYVWGGNTPEQGFDCSGFICEILRSGGKLDKRDLTAQGLFDHVTSGIAFASYNPGKNCLLFFGESDTKITHVALGISDTQMIEAGGEGRNPTDRGFVRVRPYDYRGDLIASIKL